jgi:hypothetical protein
LFLGALRRPAAARSDQENIEPPRCEQGFQAGPLPLLPVRPPPHASQGRQAPGLTKLGNTGSEHRKKRDELRAAETRSPYNIWIARVFLIFGDPSHGKSTLAENLRADHAFEVLSVDDVYVKFVKSHYPRIYFDDLNLYIAHHYQYVFCLIPDRLTVWHKHLLKTVFERSARCESLAVEGYLLADCKDNYEALLTQSAIQVFQIHAEHLSYWTRCLTVEQIASFGSDAKKGARKA